MVTKAIIEKVTTTVQDNKNLYLYTVRIPIFHGYKENGATPSEYLPQAVYCSPPHTEQTKFSVGDLVFVALENYDLSEIVILGMAPGSRTEGVYGSATTNTMGVYQNVDTIEFNKGGSAILPKDSIMYIDKTHTTPTKIGYPRDYISSTEFSHLYGVESNLQGQLDGISTSTSNLNTLFNITPSFADVDPGGVENFLVFYNKEHYLERSGLIKVGYTYTFTYGGSGYWMANNEDGEPQYFTEIRLNSCGIRYGNTYSPSNGHHFKIKITSSALGISAGGTGATTAQQARENFGVYATKLIGQSDFEDQQNANSLESNTVYYIYDDGTT